MVLDFNVHYRRIETSNESRRVRTLSLRDTTNSETLKKEKITVNYLSRKCYLHDIISRVNTLKKKKKNQSPPISILCLNGFLCIKLLKMVQKKKKFRELYKLERFNRE